jgi:hypothetical protein
VTAVLGVILAVLVVVAVLRLVSRRQLLVKYAVLWIFVASLLFALAFYPPLLAWLAGILGFAVPANLLFFASIGLLLAIALQLSFEVSRIERRLQRVAEEVALMGAKGRSVDDPQRDSEDHD